MDDIAMSSSITNEARAEWAQQAIDAYQRVTGTSGTCEALGDLLTDLHHWADLHGVEWDEVLYLHDRHYSAERESGVIQGEVLKDHVGDVARVIRLEVSA